MVEIILRMATTTTLRVKILATIRRTMTVKAPAVDVIIPLLSRRIAALVRHLQINEVCSSVAVEL